MSTTFHFGLMQRICKGVDMTSTNPLTLGIGPLKVEGVQYKLQAMWTIFMSPHQFK